MRDEDKAISTISPSKNEELLTKVDKRDKLVRIIEITMLLVVVVFAIFTGISLQRSIDSNRLEAGQRSSAAQTDRDEQKNYIKCVLLIRFDTPPEDLTTRVGLSKALDKCAKQSVLE